MTDDQQAEQLDSARKLARQVSDLVSDGKDAAARGVFTRTWRDSVPDLPSRFPVTLENVDERTALAVARLIGGGSEPQLGLRRRKGSYEVYAIGGHHENRLGDLPAADSEFLIGLGKQASLFEPFLLQIKSVEARVICAIELVRAEQTAEADGAPPIAFQDAVEALPNE